ncbi:MAG: glycosyltransferase family 4 protein [Anaerolineae bacterium]|jgi:glycosyltransferase involved in cell wall biosynthesis
MEVGVCMICTEFYPLVGGMQTHTLQLSRHLQRHGVHVTVMTRHYDNLPSFERVDGVDVHRVFTWNRSWAGASLSFTLASIQFLIQQRAKYQIIHSHQVYSPATIGLIGQSLLGKKLVVNPHRGGYLGDVYRLSERRFGQQRLALLRDKADCFIVISREIEKELQQIGVPQSKLKFIPNGVNTDHFVPVEDRRKEHLKQRLDLPKGPIVAFVGRLVPAKNVSLLVDLWERFPDTGAHLLILGDGPRRASLENSCQDKGLTDKVLFTGNVENVAQYLQCSDIYVLPSLTEGLPVALLEAMACSLPVVASSVGGVPELLQDGVNGFLVSPGNAQDFHDKLATLLVDRELQHKMGSQARQTILSNYSLSTISERYLALYKDLLNQN